MSRKYLNDKWCVRCGRNTATPYLRQYAKLFPDKGRVLDIGCGNGRNTRFMQELGYTVDSVDMAGDFGTKRVLGRESLPNRRYDILLANYILMFLNEKERSRVMEEMHNRSGKNAMLMVEMYPALDAYEYSLDEIIDYFLDKGWKRIRKSKERFIVRRESA
jgi:trans-aconitate methyltransferase